MATTYVKPRELPSPALWTVKRNLGMSVITLCRGTEAKCREWAEQQHRSIVSEFNGVMYVL